MAPYSCIGPLPRDSASTAEVSTTDLFPEHPLDPVAVRVQVDRILGSVNFRSSPKISKFLQFVTEATLTGRSQEVKETTIGVSVYGRPPSYDPKLDTVVRTEARRLRQKLDRYFEEDGKDDPIRVILPKGGYVPSFEITVAKPGVVEPPQVAELAVQAVDSPPVSTYRPRWSGLATLLMTATVLAVLSILFLIRMQTHTDSGSSNVSRISPLTSFPGEAYQPDVSPDGKSVAFIWNNGTPTYSIYIIQAGGRPLRVTAANATDIHPVWSPDGSTLAFLRVNASGAHIMSIAFPGGAEKRLTDLKSDRPWSEDQLGVRNDAGPSWTPDGRALIVSDTAPSGHGLGLYRFDLATGNLEPLTHPQFEERDLNPVASPDGRRIAFSRFLSYDSADIFTVSTVDGVEHRLTNDQMDLQGLAWDHKNTRIIFSSDRSGAYGLWSIALEDSMIKSIPTTGESAIQPSLSRDGRLLVYADSSSRSQLRKTRTTGNPASSENNIISPSTRRSHSAQYSPDGSRLVFVSDRSGKWELWMANADGTGASQVTNFSAASVGSPRWSPSGKFVSFDARPHGHSAIFVLSVKDGAVKQLSPPDAEEKQPAWSPDGAWLYFNSNRDGVMRFWKMRVNGLDASVAANITATDPRFTSNGQNVIFTKGTSGLWRLDLRSGSIDQIPGLEHARLGRLWTVVDDTIYFVDTRTDRTKLMIYDLRTHRSRSVSDLPTEPLTGYPSLAFLSSDRSFLFATNEDVRSDLMQIRAQK